MQMDEKWLHPFSMNSIKRLTVLLVGIAFALLGLASNLIRIMVWERERYLKLAYAIERRERTIKAPRGIIYDRNGTVIASNEPVCSVSVIHVQLENEEQVATELSKLLGLDKEELLKKIQKKTAREIIKTNVPKDVAMQIRNLHLAGVMVDEDYKRYYPYGSLASHVIGFTGADNQGILGIETAYDKVLMGTPGSIDTLTDAKGVEIYNAEETRTYPVSGKNLVLTIDVNIQSYLEQRAMEILEKKQAKRVSIIMMNPQNGEIYGMADVPEYDLNSPFELNEENLEEAESETAALNKMWRCSCISDTYEPGSTFKIITATAALEEKKVSLSDSFFCPGYKVVEDRRIRCSKTTGHGAEDFRLGIMNSCNPVFMELGSRVGADAFYKWLKQLGFFEKTGIDLPGEAGSIFHKLENVGPVELATMSFGQSFQITPLQLLRAVSCVLNGGTLVTPHFGAYITDDKNTIIDTFSYGTKAGCLEQTTCETMKTLLEAVVAEGTGKNAYVEGFQIGGKTATSEKLPRRSGKYIASFLGFAPADNPKVVTLLMIDEPKGTYYGGQIAAPEVGRIYEDILPYLGIKRENVIPQEESTDDLKETFYFYDKVF